MGRHIIKAGLEISGIGATTPTNSVTARIKEKRKQTDKSKHLKLPIYIIIVEFSQPMAQIEKK